ncbi:MAG TPA: hypothetical protein VFV08_05000 [Puia sp.]|nr:hypothetical protein [Puia sp.]
MKSKKEVKAYPPEQKIALYDQFIESIPKMERKGDTIPYTSVNGHMFSFLDKKGEMALRLPEKLRSEFLDKFHTHLAEQFGMVMKEYVVVPDDMLKQKVKLKKYFEDSYEYVSALKPKPTKKGTAKKSGRK